MKKILLIIFTLLLGVVSFSLSINSVFAQTESAKIRDVEELVQEREQKEVQDQNYNPQNLDMGTNSDVPKNLSTYTQSVFIEMISATSCLISGVDPIRTGHPCLGFDPETKKIGYIENSGGALGLMGNMIAATFDIPASTSDYVKYIAGNFGISQKANAGTLIDDSVCVDNPERCQGDGNSDLSFGTGNGFEGLRPLLNIWTTMRNLVYLLFVLLFIVIGLGIMFRIQIDPRAVMSIQSQLPKIVITLLLVTFSYAIAGVLIDMMYLSLFLIINIFQGQGLEISTAIDTNPINAAGGLGSSGISGIAYDASSGIAAVMTSLFDGTIGSVIKGMINVIFGVLMGAGMGAIVPIPGVGAILGGVIGGILGGASGFLPGIPEPFTLVVGAIAWVIIIIALLSALFRLWFTLIKTYVFILINITFAPIWIAFGLLPGSSLSFGNWIRALASDLMAFPIVLVLFSLGKTLQEGFSKSDSAFVPPYVGDPGDMSVFSSIIGMGIILLAPEAVNMAKSALKAPDSKLTGAVGRSLSVGQGAVGKLGGSIKNAVWYTNPHTGESGRLKAFTGEKVNQGLAKVPGANKVKNLLTTKKKREADKLAKAQSAAEIARLKAGGYYVEDSSRPEGGPTPTPAGQTPTPVNTPEPESNTPEPEGGAAATPQNPSNDGDTNGGPQGGSTT